MAGTPPYNAAFLRVTSNRKRTCYFLLGNGQETRWICPMLITQSPCFRLLGWLGVWFFLTGGGHAQLTGGAATVSAGVSIGQVRIGETLDDVHRALGTPKLSDAAMGGKLLFSHQTRIRGQSRISRVSQKINRQGRICEAAVLGGQLGDLPLPGSSLTWDRRYARRTQKPWNKESLI
jgi:hypothetical protein